MSTADLEEIKALEQTIAVFEAVKDIRRSTSENNIFDSILRNARQRIETLKDKVQVDERRETAERVYAMEESEREQNLNEVEQEEFTGFLRKKFFTREDMARVDRFYRDSWDKLSDQGKQSLSHRVWEGVRQGAYKISEFGNVVEKEGERIYLRLSGEDKADSSLSKIPEQDRADFIKAYKDGDRKEIGEILDRQSFTNSVSLSDVVTKSSTAASQSFEESAMLDVVKPTELPRTGGAKVQIP